MSLHLSRMNRQVFQQMTPRKEMEDQKAVDMDAQLLGVAGGIVGAFAANRSMTEDDLIRMIARTVNTLRAALAAEIRLEDVLRVRSYGIDTSLLAASEPQVDPDPPVVVPIKHQDLVSEGGIMCLECHRRFRVLKAHVRTAHRLSIEKYRLKHGLPDDTPTISPDLKNRMSERAIVQKLGNKKRRHRR